MRKHVLVCTVFCVMTSLALAQVEWDEGTIAGSFDGAIVVQLADMDSDGDLDVVGGATADGLCWWENLHGFPVPHVIDAGFHYPSALDVADMNQDGTLDVIVGSSFQQDELRVYYNMGETWDSELLFTFSVRDLAVADADGDGDMDIATTDGALKLLISEYNSFTVYPVESTGGPYFDVDFVDMDQNGIKDMLLCNHGSAQGPDYGSLSWWEYSGDDFEEHMIREDFYSCSYVAAADMDNDGDMDVIGGATGQQRCWYNMIDGWVQVDLPDDNSMGYDVQTGDIDGDGYADAVICGDGSVLAWWKNNHNQTYTRYDVTADLSGITAISMGDYDSDGDLDIVAAGRVADRIGIWKQVGGIPQYTLDLIPVVAQVPAIGGNVVFDAETWCAQAVIAQGWTMVQAPNGQTYGPLMLVPVSLEGEGSRTGLTQYVPAGAPAGTYTLTGYVGYHRFHLVLMSDSFEFVKEGVATSRNSEPVTFPPGSYPGRLAGRQ